jgi:hypothetical protein
MADSGVPVDVDFALPGPTINPSGLVEHATGPRDIVLRYDSGPDHGELTQVQFQPGPEFTLYGDGRVTYRDETAEYTRDGPLVLGTPFMISRLSEDEIQALLGYALGAGGLGIARSRYSTGGEGCWGGTWTFTVHLGGYDKQVEVLGCWNPFEALAQHLRTGAGAPPGSALTGGQYVGSLLAAKPWIEAGLLRKPAAAEVLPWPWPDIKPADFGEPVPVEMGSDQRRMMSADELDALGVARDGAVVGPTYVRGPDGKTLYTVSVWPLLPDQTG